MTEDRLSWKLQNWLDKNEEFKGRFVGYKENRGGLGISRIDDDWWNCEDYLIPFSELIEALEEMEKNGTKPVL